MLTLIFIIQKCLRSVLIVTSVLILFTDTLLFIVLSLQPVKEKSKIRIV